MKDDRYRISQTSEAISASFWEVAREYGISDRIAVDEQVAICKRLAKSLRAQPGPLTRHAVDAAFRETGVRVPPNGFARDLIARLERVVG
jgi:hypothetical protein